MVEPLMDVDDLAAYLKVPVRWIYKEVQANRLPHIRLGRRLRFRRSDIDAWLEEYTALAGRFTPAQIAAIEAAKEAGLFLPARRRRRRSAG